MKPKILLLLLAIFLLGVSPLPAATVVLEGTLDNFDGPNDLDLTGIIPYAVNLGNTPQIINGVPFTLSAATPGFSTTNAAAPFAWTSYGFTDGAPADNAALNNVMSDILCCGSHTYSFTVIPGNDYQVQALWGENGGNQAVRNWDIAIEGAQVVDQVFSNGIGPPGPNNPGNQGTRWTHTLTALDISLDIAFGQIGLQPSAGGDSNYVLSAIIVEDLGPAIDLPDVPDLDPGPDIDLPPGGGFGSAAVPEPASIAIWSLIGLALGGWGYARRKRS